MSLSETSNPRKRHEAADILRLAWEEASCHAEEGDLRQRAVGTRGAEGHGPAIPAATGLGREPQVPHDSQPLPAP